MLLRGKGERRLTSPLTAKKLYLFMTASMYTGLYNVFKAQ
jgi:hypothetical protein